MNIEVIRYRLPVYWAHALINDDYTGLLDNEEQEIRNFLKRVKADPVSVDWKTEGFYWYNNANNTPGECVDFIFHRCNNRKMNKIIEDYKKIVAGNEAGKNICFMSRGEYADPKIAYNGILMNYWDVYDCMDEVEEPTDDDWLNAVSNLFDSYTYDIKNTDVDKFKMSDVMNVYRIINL